MVKSEHIVMAVVAAVVCAALIGVFMNRVTSPPPDGIYNVPVQNQPRVVQQVVQNQPIPVYPSYDPYGPGPVLYGPDYVDNSWWGGGDWGRYERRGWDGRNRWGNPKDWVREGRQERRDERRERRPVQAVSGGGGFSVGRSPVVSPIKKK